MTEINPLLLTGGVIGAITAILVAAYALVKDKKATMGQSSGLPLFSWL